MKKKLRSVLTMLAESKSSSRLALANQIPSLDPSTAAFLGAPIYVEAEMASFTVPRWQPGTPAHSQAASQPKLQRVYKASFSALPAATLPAPAPASRTEPAKAGEGAGTANLETRFAKLAKQLSLRLELPQLEELRIILMLLLPRAVYKLKLQIRGVAAALEYHLENGQYPEHIRETAAELAFQLKRKSARKAPLI